jgi:lipopolysaccharide transport protein LptA
MAVASLTLFSTLAWSQERQQLSLDAGVPVTVYADRIENMERERLLIAEGNVQIEQGDVRLEANRVEVNTETGEAVATGDVVLFDGRTA